MTGVFPVHDLVVEVDTAENGAAAAFVPIKDMETVNVNIETGVEKWSPLDQGGWQRALATAKAVTLSFSGKRCYGDAGNDYIASKALAVGRDCDSTLRITFPDSATFTMPCVISVSEFLGGEATKVAPLGFDAASNGKPDYTPAQA